MDITNEVTLKMTALTKTLLASFAALPFVMVYALPIYADDKTKPHYPPMTVAVSQLAWAGNGKSWSLSMNSSGKAILTIETLPRMSHEFLVSQMQIEEIAGIIEREKFFFLNRSYGDDVPDLPLTIVTIAYGSQANTVRIASLANLRNKPEQLIEPGRALRVLLAIRSWFADEKAVDTSKVNRMMLDIVEGLSGKKDGAKFPR